MQLRVVSIALVVGVVSVAVLGAFLSQSIRDGLFNERLAAVDAESARSTTQARTNFDAANPQTSSDVQQLLTDMVLSLQTASPGTRDVFLWHPQGQPSQVVDVSTADRYGTVITPEMRKATLATADSGGEVPQVMQSVAIETDPGPDAAEVPGVVVGTTVQVPREGTYELYYLYSFEPEQQTLEFIQQTLFVGAIVLLLIIGVIAWIVTRQTVDPVSRAARVAERLAAGRLDERLTVRGHDEMATLARSFNEMAESLQDQITQMEELSMLQRRFVSDVSHELRTPLTTIRMASEVIHESRDELDPMARRSAELMYTQLDRFEDLLADLLEISRFDAGAAVLDAERSDLRDVAGSAVEQAQPLAEAKRVWLSVHLGDEPATADVDPRRVERILRNLVTNAIEHAEGKPVEVTVGADGLAVAVVVRDHGVGMTAPEVARVFDRFWRADPARARTTGGTGLGLAISLEDARLHGGWLEAWGRPGEGACFRLTLPRRAGIVLDHSPLPLVPDAPSPARGSDPEPGPVTGQVAVVDQASPTSLPSVDALEPPPGADAAKEVRR
nr:MtrAB system histidine kinase MtrB [Cellulomonas sp. PhB143]